MNCTKCNSHKLGKYKNICQNCYEKASREKWVCTSCWIETCRKKYTLCQPCSNRINGRRWNYKHSEETKIKIKLTTPRKRWSEHPMWKWGITWEYKKIRQSPTYKWWRFLVFERDNYTCMICQQIWWKLEAHHIKTFIKYPELRFDINNWICLCKHCHNQTKWKEEKFESEFYKTLFQLP